MVDIKCPICGEMYKGLNLDETDGWFVCQKYNIEVMLLKYAKTCVIPMFTSEGLVAAYKKVNKNG